MTEITYEVIGYKTQNDYSNMNGVILDEGIHTKEESLRVAKIYFGVKKNQVVKVQSSDREFIEVFKVEILSDIRKPVYELSDAIMGLNGLKLTDPKLKVKLDKLNKLNREIFDYLNKNYIWD